MGRYILTLAMLVTLMVAVRSALAADEIHEGKVTAVGDGKITVLDNRDDDNDTFVVTVDTKITRNGKSAKLSDIQPGDKAKVLGSSQSGMLIAKEISATAPQ
jgi:hypothetical protein